MLNHPDAAQPRLQPGISTEYAAITSPAGAPGDIALLGGRRCAESLSPAARICDVGVVFGRSAASGGYPFHPRRAPRGCRERGRGRGPLNGVWRRLVCVCFKFSSLSCRRRGICR